MGSVEWHSDIMMHMLLSLQRQMAWLINSAALVLLCYLAAHWTWNLLSPKQVSLQPMQTLPLQPRESGVAAYHIFGGGRTDAALPPGIKLDGVFAPKGGMPGAAIFNEAGKGNRVVLVNDQVSPGFVLEQVAGDHVVLGHGGATLTLKLESIAPELDIGSK